MYILNLSIKKLARQRHSIKKYYLSTTKPSLYTTSYIWHVYKYIKYVVPYLSKRTTSHTIPNIHNPFIIYHPTNSLPFFNSTVLYYIYSEPTQTATFLSHPPKIYYTQSIHFHPLNATPPKRIVQYKTNLGNVRWNLIQCFVAVLCVYFFFIISV